MIGVKSGVEVQKLEMKDHKSKVICQRSEKGGIGQEVRVLSSMVKVERLKIRDHKSDIIHQRSGNTSQR